MFVLLRVVLLLRVVCWCVECCDVGCRCSLVALLYLCVRVSWLCVVLLCGCVSVRGVLFVEVARVCCVLFVVVVVCCRRAWIVTALRAGY